MRSHNENLLPGQPDGLFIFARVVNKRTGVEVCKYSSMVLTKDNLLAALCNDGNWYLIRKLNPGERDYAEKHCFKSQSEQWNWTIENLMLAA